MLGIFKEFTDLRKDVLLFWFERLQEVVSPEHSLLDFIVEVLQLLIVYRHVVEDQVLFRLALPLEHGPDFVWELQRQLHEPAVDSAVLVTSELEENLLFDVNRAFGVATLVNWLLETFGDV